MGAVKYFLTGMPNAEKKSFPLKKEDRGNLHRKGALRTRNLNYVFQ